MQNDKKLKILIVLAIIAFISLAQGILRSSRGGTKPASASSPEIKKSISSKKIIPLERKAKKTK